jgi:hypothetical protein
MTDYLADVVMPPPEIEESVEESKYQKENLPHKVPMKYHMHQLKNLMKMN